MKPYYLASLAFSLVGIFNSVAAAQGCDVCEAALKNAVDQKILSTSSTYSQTLNELFSHDYTYWSNYASSNNHTTSGDAAYGMFGASFSNGVSSSEAKENFETMKITFQKNSQLNSSQNVYLWERYASPVAYNSFTACVTANCGTGIKLEQNGISDNDFTVALSFVAAVGIGSQTVSNVVATNLKIIGGDLKKNATLAPFNTLLAHVRRIKSTLPASLTVSVSNLGSKTIAVKETPLTPKGSAMPVGSIISSFLNYSQFSSVAGDPQSFDPTKNKWTPADGRAVTGSKYADYSRVVPDLRGIFLRGANIMDPTAELDPNFAKVPSNQKNPEPTNVGDFQADQFREHRHNLRAGPYSPQHAPSVTGGRSLDPRRDNEIGPGGAVGGFTDTDGGSETRPKNITVFYYVRINP